MSASETNPEVAAPSSVPSVPSVPPSKVPSSSLSRRFSDDGQLSEVPSGSLLPWGWLIGTPLVLLLLVFLPLGLAIVEGIILKTRRVEEFFERIGLHDELSAIYGPVARLFAELTGISP
jgi:hypothetical protein